ncbi:hypothetical protein XELAEV_18003181mg [Xenopus laevis]|nr:hypothetical protein XELAEV_18003181mg [Xenopus laevis]
MNKADEIPVETEGNGEWGENPGSTHLMDCKRLEHWGTLAEEEELNPLNMESQIRFPSDQWHSGRGVIFWEV